MKKALSLLMAVMMLLSLLALPVYAGADDGFNDGSFPSWGDECAHVYDDDYDETCNICGAERVIDDSDNNFNDDSFDNWECNHDYKAVVTEPTCLAGGYTTYTCALCNDSYVGNETAILDHVYDDDADATCNVCGTEREIEEPFGSLGNPIAFSKPADIYRPEFATYELAPGGKVYYQIPALKFTNWILTFIGATGVENAADPNVELNVSYDPLTRGYKVVLESGGNLIAVCNDTEETVTLELKLEEPKGTMDSPFDLADGENEISIPLDYTYYYMRYQTIVLAGYDFSFSDSENFKYYYDTDGNPSTTDDWEIVDAEWTMVPEETYVDLFLIAEPITDVRELIATVTPPQKGTAVNPYAITSHDELVAGVSGEGDGLWPTSSVGTNYNLLLDAGATLIVECEGTANLVLGVVAYDELTWEETTTWLPEIVVDGRAEIELTESSYKAIITTAEDGFVKLSMTFPLGTEKNPQPLNKGKNALNVTDGIGYFASFVAEKDGVVVITPSSLLGLGYTDAANQTSGNGEYDFIYQGYLNDEGVIEGASEDFVLKVAVKAGEELLITTITEEYETPDGDYLWPENVTLYVCYEDDHNVTAPTCTKAGKCATCGLPGDNALGHTYKTVTVKATTTANGYTVKRCSVCKAETGKKTLYKVTSFTLSKTSYTYNGKVQKPTVTVKNSAGTKLTEGTSYTVSYASGLKNAGTYKVTITLKGNYSGTKTLTYKINPANVSTCKVTLSKTSYTYNGKVQKPTVTVKNAAGTKLTNGGSYTVTYASGLKAAGTYKVTVKMKGNYTGTKTLTYKINPINVSKCKITLSKTSYTYNGKAQKPTVTVKNASGTKLSTASYTVTYASGCKNVGTYKVTIKMKGNYTGTKTLTFKINPAKTTLSSLTAGAKKLTVKWAKKTTQVTGYEIQYSTSKSFKSVKTKTITKNSTTSTALTGLKAKTTYYVRVRTYKTVNGVKYYSGWTTVKTAKTK